jgi:hypothetical protein
LLRSGLNFFANDVTLESPQIHFERSGELDGGGHGRLQWR